MNYINLFILILAGFSLISCGSTPKYISMKDLIFLKKDLEIEDLDRIFSINKRIEESKALTSDTTINGNIYKFIRLKIITHQNILSNDDSQNRIFDSSPDNNSTAPFYILMKNNKTYYWCLENEFCTSLNPEIKQFCK